MLKLLNLAPLQFLESLKLLLSKSVFFVQADVKSESLFPFRLRIHFILRLLYRLRLVLLLLKLLHNFLILIEALLKVIRYVVLAIELLFEHPIVLLQGIVSAVFEQGLVMPQRLLYQLLLFFLLKESLGAERHLELGLEHVNGLLMLAAMGLGRFQAVPQEPAVRMRLQGLLRLLLAL